MKAFRNFISFLIFTSIFSCQPEELPPPETGDPVFSVTGGSVNITAGEDDFYLFSDYTKDAQEVYSFIARFAKTSDCATDCEEELLIEIRDAQQTSGAGGVDIDLALIPGNYVYKVMNPNGSNDMVILDLMAEPEGTGLFSYKWSSYYNNSPVDSFITPIPQYSFVFENNLNIPSLEVCLAISNNNDCAIEYCNTINLNTNVQGCQADFSVDSTAPAVFQLEANMINGTAPFSYQWNTGSTAQILTIGNNTGTDTYCVTITDSTGCTDEMCKEITLFQGGTLLKVCASRFSYEKTILPGGGDSLQLSTVFIQYTNSAGDVFRSDFQAQPNSANFVIHSVEQYKNNEKGDKTKKLRITANCLLYNAVGDSLVFPFEGVIAVAYP